MAKCKPVMTAINDASQGHGRPDGTRAPLDTVGIFYPFSPSVAKTPGPNFADT